MAKWRTEDELMLELEREVEKFDTDSAAAAWLGVTRGHLSRVLSGEKPITAKIARALGYEPMRCFVRL
jgi:plasmid maintenance system antidote protein VapI